MSDLTLAGTAHRNRLADQTSPYLLQHADNPVDWYPWGEEALELARREDRPILLSIGYSACHWCHVMAHESFEDPETARLMNAGFVNIKVDREERPDLDRIYQAAHQILTGRGGGWPLTLFLTPDQTPFFGGTYFPPEARHGLPGFPQLLERVAQFYRENRDRIHEQNAAVQEALSRDTPAEAAPGNLNGSPLAKGVEQLAGSHDRHHGGFGGAPKFPHASSLEFLLRQGGGEARDIALHTLRAMARGGIRDHLGGGFYRYSVDERWMIPHFEKMLYDNGPLLTLYADAWRTTGDRIFRQAAETTGTWVLREMQSPEGAYFATQDADSEGREGAYYLWTPGQARALLDEDEYQVLAHRYGLDGPANFEGQWHLHIQTDPGTAATESGLEEDQAKALLERAVDKLFAARSERVPPGRDEKVLTAWNALMLKGMARAGRLLGRGDFIASAERSLDFIRAELYRDGRLFTACRDGKGRLPAYLDDHAFLIDGVLELLQARWRDGDLAFALELAEILLEHFEDESGGGFFFTADDHERLIQRPKPFMDESTPAGNGIAAMALNRLGHIVGDMNLLDAAQRTVSAAWPALQEIPYAHASLLMALEELLEPSQILVLRGGTEALTPWANTLDTGYAPHRITLVIPPEARDLPELLAAHRPEPGTVMAYLCKDRRCTPPLRDPAALAEALRE